MVSSQSDDGNKRPLSSSKDTCSKDTNSPLPFVRLPIYGEHKRAVSSVALASDKPLCASASADGTVKIWNIPQSTTDLQKDTPLLLQPSTTLIGHSRGINQVAWSRNSHVATASDDKTLRLWDATTGDALVEFRGHVNFVFCTKFNAVGNLLVSGGFDETVKLWDVRSGDCVSTLPAHSDPVTGVDFNRDGTCVVSGSHDGLLRIWDTATGECLKTIYASGNPPVSHVEYSPNGKYVLAGTLDSKLRLWHMATAEGAKCAKIYSSNNHVNTKYCIASKFMPRRNCIVTGSETGNVVLYDIQSRKVQQVLEGGHVDAVLAVASHEQQDLLVSGGMTKDKTVQFWKPKEEGEEIMESNKRAKVEEQSLKP